MSTAHTSELNADTARELAADTRASIDYVTNKSTFENDVSMWVIMRLLDIESCQHELITHAFARIEALEAAAREREGDL